MRADFLHNRLKHNREVLNCWKSACGKNGCYRLGECYNQKHRIPALKVLSGVFTRNLGGTVEFMLHPLVLGMKLYFFYKGALL